MANEEHKRLANILKEVHSSLRKSTSKLGANEAWRKHCKDTDVLRTYAEAMEKLATIHWEQNYSNETSSATSRIKWSADLCYDYFINKSYIKYRCKEQDIGLKINMTLGNTESFSDPVKLIDVGSCYNPFKVYTFLEVLAIDLCPANETVLQCDFLDVRVGTETIVENNVLQMLSQNMFAVVTFCFLLEYIPSSELRIKACEKAYSILKSGGLLIINTPDSKHVGANSRLMKCWRYTLAHIGFTRIKYEKLKHMHCMAFRKCLHKDIAVRWAHLHKEAHMQINLLIPQDLQKKRNLTLTECKATAIDTSSYNDFNELPFCASD